MGMGVLGGFVCALAWWWTLSVLVEGSDIERTDTLLRRGELCSRCSSCVAQTTTRSSRSKEPAEDTKVACKGAGWHAALQDKLLCVKSAVVLCVPGRRTAAAPPAARGSMTALPRSKPAWDVHSTSSL